MTYHMISKPVVSKPVAVSCLPCIHNQDRNWPLSLDPWIGLNPWMQGKNFIPWFGHTHLVNPKNCGFETLDKTAYFAWDAEPMSLGSK